MPIRNLVAHISVYTHLRPTNPLLPMHYACLGLLRRKVALGKLLCCGHKVAGRSPWKDRQHTPAGLLEIPGGNSPSANDCDPRGRISLAERTLRGNIGTLFRASRRFPTRNSLISQELQSGFRGNCRYLWRCLQPCLPAITSAARGAKFDQPPSVYSRR
jgi:hypothetical protein